jgi:hypothetical protein
VLRKALGPKMDEMVQGWIRLHNGEHCNLYSSPNTRIIRMIKSRTMGWVRHAAHIGEKNV